MEQPAVLQEQATSSRARRGLVVVALAGALIGAVVTWRLLYPPEPYRPNLGSVESRRPAPAFTGVDQNNRPFRLEAFLHRHAVLLCFFDSTTNASATPLMQRLHTVAPSLQAEGVRVVGISTALPQENRAGGVPWSFPLITDPAPFADSSAHRSWRRLSEDTTQNQSARPRTLPGVFLIFRDGAVAWDSKANAPLEVTEPQALINGLLEGSVNFY